MMFILLAFIIACGGIGFAYQKKLSGKYCLQATDTLEQMHLCVLMPNGDCEGDLVPQTVYAVGWDEQFIIAKQHPSAFGRPIDRTVTYFYIVRVSDGKVSDRLDERSFNVERSKLGVPRELSFTLVLDELK
jgi:hypothetical protein